MTKKEEIGKRLKAHREKSGHSLKSLESATDGIYSASRIGNYEQGTRTMSVEAAIAIAPILGTTAAYLLCVNLSDDPVKDQPEITLEELWEDSTMEERAEFLSRLASKR